MRVGRNWKTGLASAGIALIVVGCGKEGDGDPGSKDGDIGPDGLRGSRAAGLYAARDCEDLLTKIQDDAIMKLDLEVELYKTHPPSQGGVVPGPGRDLDADGDGVAVDDPNGAGDPVPAEGGDGDQAGGGSDDGKGESEDPTGGSDTNTQVAGVDEADFVKVVNDHKQMFVLHGNKLFKLKSWPAKDTALDGDSLTIEGLPSEMFVSDGKAVVFSSVFGYGRLPNDRGYDYCGPDYCGGSNFTKITIADVSGDVPKTLRELYYEGYYVSSRRYDSVVRVVMQAGTRYFDLYTPDVEWTDAWGRAYSDDVIAAQLDEWRERTASAIRNTKLSDWLPLVQEARDEKLVDVDPACDSYLVPQAGITQYGLTHILSLNMEEPGADIGGATVLGQTSTVYSNAGALVLAQPDYRAIETDFGFVDQQQTALHVFEIEGAATSYRASGFVPGMLAGNIPQFALHEQDGVIFAATTGWERAHPNAKENTPEFWETTTVNRVVTAKAKGEVVEVIDELSPLGHKDERIMSSRFLGKRGYIVTFRNIDPLIVVDLTKPEALSVLGEIEIPGFSEYMHPLDDDHLVTLGQSGSLWGSQLQIFDVSNPAKPEQTHVFDLGEGSSSEASYQHKAFTFYAEKSLLALPVHSYTDTGFSSALRVLRVRADKGFSDLGGVDHSSLITQQTCGICKGEGDCYETSCYEYAPVADVRRGHFVSSADSTYVYSFSYGGVLVNELSDLESPLATVELPSPEWDATPWYAPNGIEPGKGDSPEDVDGGSDVGGGDTAGEDAGVDIIKVYDAGAADIEG